MFAAPPTTTAILRAVTSRNASMASAVPLSSDFYWLGASHLHSQLFVEEARSNPVAVTPNDAEGFMGGDVDTIPDTPEYQRFRVAYNRFFGRDLSLPTPPWAANTYDAAMLIALAVTSANSTKDRRAIRDGIGDVTQVDNERTVFGPTEVAQAIAALRRGQKIHYSGASTKIIFDDGGTVTNPTVIWQIKDGELATVYHYTEDEIAEVNARAVPIDLGGLCGR